LEERFLVHPDDLTRIWGVGDKAQSALYAAGIMIYEQLARLSPAELGAILEETGLRAHHLTSWPGQARLAASGEWDQLASYKDRLS
jgi:predicted flap endonuclease-1-like 5' DNA nuclease